MKNRYRETVAIINLKNLYTNYIEVQKRVGNKVIIPVVKANAYGHGAIEVVDYLHSKGVDYFAVSLLEEALDLREKFSDIQILCMGVVDQDGLVIASEKNITVSICNLDQIKNLSKYTNIDNFVQINEFISLNTKNNKRDFEFLQHTDKNDDCKNTSVFEGPFNNENISIYENESISLSSFNENVSVISQNEKSGNFVDLSNSENIKFLDAEIFEEAAEISQELKNIGKSQKSEKYDKKSEALIQIEKLKDEQSSISIGSLKMTKILKIHLNIDTGMNRLGFKSDEEIKFAFDQLNLNPMIYVEGIFTHFSTADVDKSHYDIQMRNFDHVLSMIDYKFELVHTSNSSAQIKYESLVPFTTHTRLGISLYGLTLDKETKFLMNTFALKTKISQLKYLVPGDKVGYGATYIASGHEIVGVLPIGYADGFIRKNQGGDVEINGKRYPIVGRICMDQMFIKVDNSVTKNDEVILFGGLVSIDEVAERLETINYEVICSISDRVPREYIK